MKYAFLLGLFLTSQVAVAQESSKDDQYLESKKQFISDQFKDPYSVKYKDVFVVTNEKGVKIVCGELNAKNSYGAYTGHQHFFLIGDEKFNVQSQFPAEEHASFLMLKNIFCKK